MSKEQTVTEKLVIEHCEQIIEFAEETMEAIADKDKLQELTQS